MLFRSNVISEPLVTVITEIGFDHVGMLGDTLAEIAVAKAGIIKNGVPIVSESTESEAKEVIIRTAEEKHAEFIDASLAEYRITNYAEPMGFNFAFEGSDNSSGCNIRMDDVRIGLTGEHQVRNAITAILAVESMRARGCVEIDEQQMRQGLMAARNMGRFEILNSDPYVVIDGAHNTQGLQAAVDALVE